MRRITLSALFSRGEVTCGLRRAVGFRRLQFLRLRYKIRYRRFLKYAITSAMSCLLSCVSSPSGISDFPVSEIDSI